MQSIIAHIQENEFPAFVEWLLEQDPDAPYPQRVDTYTNGRGEIILMVEAHPVRDIRLLASLRWQDVRDL
jgi:hypothetical protein